MKLWPPGCTCRSASRTGQFPRVQIATIEDLLNGHGPDLPRLGLADAPTFRRAARRRAPTSSQRML